jgi:hypothetical protein
LVFAVIARSPAGARASGASLQSLTLFGEATKDGCSSSSSTLQLDARATRRCERLPAAESVDATAICSQKPAQNAMSQKIVGLAINIFCVPKYLASHA